jgi:thiol:disulfide interchange protein DsbD
VEQLSLFAFAGALGAGFLASLSPCTYPMIPITVGYFGGHGGSSVKRSVLLYFCGQSLTLTLLAIVVVSLGETFGFSSQNPWIQGVFGVALAFFGAISLWGRLPGFMEKINAKTQVSSAAPFFMGLTAALLASPCTTPVLSSVLALLSGKATFLDGVLLMLAYSVGFSALFLALAFGVLKAKRLPKSGRWLTLLHQGSGILLVGIGMYMIFKSAGWM